ncbi:MAG: GYD domain-containing protein [Actinobacteria bacterium]|nr:GYD domain-containing protein [Actinomycetota bacterium]
METYVFTLTWTEQGLQDTRGSIVRTNEAVDTMERLGVKIFETYWTIGPFDILLVAECPDQATAQAVSLKLSRRGNVRAAAMRALDRGEMQQILDKVESLD